MDHKKAFETGTDPASGFAMVKVSRQDSKKACANLAARILDPTVAYKAGGAFMAARLADKAGLATDPDAATVVDGKTLNRDSTAIFSATAVVPGVTAGKLFIDHVTTLVDPVELKNVQDGCAEAKRLALKGVQPRIKARRAAGTPAPDGSVASSDASTVSDLSDHGHDDEDAVTTYHKGCVRMGLVAATAEGWNQSFLAYGKMMSEQDSKPAAVRTPSDKSGTKRKLSSSTGSSRTKKGT